MPAFPLANVNHHPLAVDVGDLKTAQFRAADTRRVQGHEHRAVEEVTGRVDELGYFLGTQDLRERATAFGSRNIFEQIASLQRLDIEEAERRYMLLHGAGIQLLLLKQVGLILAQVLRTEPVGRLMEMAGEFLDDPDVGFYGTLSVITSLEFLQHHSAKMGHKDTSCDPQFISMSGKYRSIYLTRSVRRASGLVQTRISSVLDFLMRCRLDRPILNCASRHVRIAARGGSRSPYLMQEPAPGSISEQYFVG